MKKIKCDVCSHWHGGFHLCIGPNADAALKKSDITYGPKQSKSEAAATGWEARHQLTEERDEAILKMYEDGYSLAQTGERFKLKHPTIKAIVERMGGTIRSRQSRSIYSKKEHN